MEALILSCGTGGGHNSAGHAMEAECRARDCKVTFLNPYDLKSTRLSGGINQLYIKTVQKFPGAFGMAYRLADRYRRLPVHSPIYSLNRLMAEVLREYLTEHPVDVILMPHLYPAEIITGMKRKGYPVPLTVFIGTDYTCIPFTEETECDCYVIPSEELTDCYVSRGIPREKLYPLGIPTAPKFASGPDREEACRRVSLEPEKKRMLITGGSMGAGQVKKAVERLCKQYDRADTELVVVCGSNTRLFLELKKEYGNRIKLVGFTEQMDLYMRASDLILTKPGGLTSTEAAVAELPMIHMGAIPGCETENMRFFERHGMSAAMQDMDRLPLLCDSILNGGGNLMRLKQRQLINKHAAADIVSLVKAQLAERQQALQQRARLAPAALP